MLSIDLQQPSKRELRRKLRMLARDMNHIIREYYPDYGNLHLPQVGELLGLIHSSLEALAISEKQMKSKLITHLFAKLLSVAQTNTKLKSEIEKIVFKPQTHAGRYSVEFPALLSHFASRRNAGQGLLYGWFPGCSTGDVVNDAVHESFKGLSDGSSLPLMGLGTDRFATRIKTALLDPYQSSVDWFANRTHPLALAQSMMEMCGQDVLMMGEEEELARACREHASIVAGFSHYMVDNLTDGKPLNAEALQQAKLPNLFDLIVCTHVFVYLHNRARCAAADKMLSHMKPDGVLLLGMIDRAGIPEKRLSAMLDEAGLDVASLRKIVMRHSSHVQDKFSRRIHAPADPPARYHARLATLLIQHAPFVLADHYSPGQPWYDRLKIHPTLANQIINRQFALFERGKI